MVTLTLPAPQNFTESVWLGIGLTFGRCFGKDLDHNIQQSDWFKKQNKICQWTLKFLLDFLHHWWIGALMMIYFPQYPEVYWFGLGLMIDDAPDIPLRLKKIFKYVWS